MRGTLSGNSGRLIDGDSGNGGLRGGRRDALRRCIVNVDAAEEKAREYS